MAVDDTLGQMMMYGLANKRRFSITGVVLVAVYIYVSVLIGYQVFARGLANGSGTPAASPALSRASTIKLVDGSADRPFVFRRLLPEIVGVVHGAVPAEVAGKI